jgi:hypothetical protein
MPDEMRGVRSSEFTLSIDLAPPYHYVGCKGESAKWHAGP